MLKYLLLFLRYCVVVCVFTNYTQLSLGQNAKTFQFPADFSKENYLPHTIVYKLKATQPTPTQAKFATTSATINPNLLTQIGASSPKALMPASHPIFQQTKNNQYKKLGERSKRLALIYQIEISHGQDFAAAINLLRQDPAVEYAEPIYTNHKPLIVPNDPLANPANATNSYHLTAIKAYQAWDIQTGNPANIIGITDNSFDLANTDLSGQSVAPAGINRDIADGDNDVSGANPHGSFVALCANAKANNNFGSAGIAYNCKFLPIKVAPNSNLNAYTDGYEGVFLAGAVTGVRVVNMSWGRTGPPSDLEQDYLAACAEDFDVVLVAAAGNQNDTELYYPASYNQYVVSVAATKAGDAKADFSTYNASVDIAAPGQSIVVVTGSPVNGTSFASPIVAGAVALIRQQYPDLTVEQTVARLKTTTDYIDNLPENATFKGKLGTGRLNAFRALSDPFKAITLKNYSFSVNKRGFLFHGMTANLVCEFKNHLDALTNLQVTLATTSPYITLTDNQSNIGIVTENTLVSNSADSFTIQVAPDTPANTIAFFTLTYTDGAYTYTEELRVLLNPGRADINPVRLAMDDRGRLAVFDNSFPELNGLNIEDYNLLREAGLMIGVNNTKVSSAVRETDFTMYAPLDEAQIGNRLEVSTAYDDITNNSNRIGLQISQKTYSWAEPALERAVVVEYQIKNISAGFLDNVYTGLFADWNINIRGENRAGWRGANAMGYVFDPKTFGVYGGISILTETDTTASSQRIHYYAIDNAANTIRINDGITEAERYQLLSGGIARTQAGVSGAGADVAHTIGVRLSDFKLGETRTVAFALIAAESLPELQTNATNILAQYKALKSSPIPAIADKAVCSGGAVLLQPTNGTFFKFYIQEPINTNIQPIHTGNSLQLTNVTTDQTIYVTCVDSVFASPAKAVNITVQPHEASFMLDNDSLNVAANDVLTLTDNSAGGTARTWAVTLEGRAVNADITFVGGTGASSANPQVQFAKTGDYQLKLTSQNGENCIDSLKRTLTVYKDITTNISEYLRQNLKVYPNPTIGVLFIELTDFQEDLQLTLADMRGRITTQTHFRLKEQPRFRWDLPNLAAGIYTLKVQTKQGYLVKKIVVGN
jgi:hypothetical protein